MEKSIIIYTVKMAENRFFLWLRKELIRWRTSSKNLTKNKMSQSGEG